MIGIQPQICWKCQLGREFKLFVFLRHFLSICSCTVLFCLRQSSICPHETL